MPSRARRREVDGRAGRFESEIRDSEAARNVLVNRSALPYCRRCQKVFEENSKVCPRCDKKDQMGRITPIPDRFIAEAERRAIREAKARVEGRL